MLERLLPRIEPLRLLLVSSGASAFAYAAWLSADTLVESGLWLCVVGFFSVWLYPIAKAQAYRALPGRSGMVNAISHIFTPLDFGMPLALGLVADQFGLLPALAVLGLQPVGLFAIAVAATSRRNHSER